MFNEYPDVLTLVDVCEVLGIGKNQASKLLNALVIKAFKIGGHWKVFKKSVEEYLVDNPRGGKLNETYQKQGFISYIRRIELLKKQFCGMK